MLPILTVGFEDQSLSHAAEQKPRWEEKSFKDPRLSRSSLVLVIENCSRGCCDVNSS